jgi:hypothetical protein
MNSGWVSTKVIILDVWEVSKKPAKSYIGFKFHEYPLPNLYLTQKIHYGFPSISYTTLIKKCQQTVQTSCINIIKWGLPIFCYQYICRTYWNKEISFFISVCSTDILVTEDWEASFYDMSLFQCVLQIYW